MIFRSNRHAPLALAVLVLLGGCATITMGTSQMVSVSTPGVSDAQCSVRKPNYGPVPVDGSGQIRVPRNQRPLTITCDKAGFATASVTLPAEIEDNAKLELPMGYLIDYLSGARYKYAKQVAIEMVASK
jgi:hypothetical protein